MNPYDIPFLNSVAQKGDELGLESVYNLFHELGDIHEKLSVVLVTGTNGKGSTCCYMASALEKAGYRVGMFTSPQVFSYEERFTVNRRPVEYDDFRLYAKMAEDAYYRLSEKGSLLPTIFEIEVAIAVLFFLDKSCDIAIMEVGMGGDLDAVNVFPDPLVCVFTSIGMDHMAFLGDTVGKITLHKAGIMRPQGDFVSVWQEDDVREVLEREAERQQGRMIFPDMSALDVKSLDPLTFSYKSYNDIRLQMKGEFQIKNALAALLAVEKLSEKGFDVAREAIYSGFYEALWAGRLEQIASDPDIFIDGAHNVPAALELKRAIEGYFSGKSITLVTGIFADKEYEKTMGIIVPSVNHVVTITPPDSRALDADILKSVIRKISDVPVCSAGTTEEAARKALSYGDDMILAAGSLSILKGMKSAFLRGHEYD